VILQKIEEKYGTGKGDGITPKAYHNRRHTEAVIKAAKKIARLAWKNNKIYKKDIGLIEVAAAFHDIVQDLGSGTNEEKSAKEAEKWMRNFGGFTDREIDEVREMILATRTEKVGGRLIQSATNNYLSQILADADLAHFGSKSEVYLVWLRKFMKEQKKEMLPGSQKEILKKHQYYTEEAKLLYPYTKKNILLS